MCPHARHQPKAKARLAAPRGGAALLEAARRRAWNPHVISLLPHIRAHAGEAAPREACGLMVVVRGRARYVPCRNLASEYSRFIIDPADYAAAEDRGAVLAVVHSHPYAAANPSPADRAACNESGLPWLIVAWPGEDYYWLQPDDYRAPLIGREFVHGVFDCYALVRDWFAQERGVALPQLAREESWWLAGGNILVENFSRFGFVEIDAASVQDGDCFLMQMPGSPVPNHCGVFVAGGAQILHQAVNRLSGRDVYGGLWRKATTHCLRYVPPRSPQPTAKAWLAAPQGGAASLEAALRLADTPLEES
jgi:proteasome lid subunit RPN8/RPN11